nr:MAG TPA: hypothetical protein [Caudoviricetes sp.]
MIKFSLFYFLIQESTVTSLTVDLFHMILSNDGLVAFLYKSYGTFCIYSKSSMIPAVESTHYRNYRAENI